MAGESARESARRQREKAERLLRAAELNERGAEGEEQTAAVLSMLPASEWTTLHDVRWPGRKYANVDHVAIGPSGVFVIDSKNWSGQITVNAQILRQNGYQRESAVAGAAEAALAVSQLTKVVPVDCVRPVLCFVREEPMTGWARDVMVCSTATLLQLLQSQPPVLTPTQVRDCSLQLDARLWAARGAPRSRRTVGKPPRPRRVPIPPTGKVRAPRRRSKRNRGPSLPRLLVALALMSVLVFEPRAVTGIGQAIAQLLVKP